MIDRLIDSVHFLLTLSVHNWTLQPFSQDYKLASHNTYVVDINFICEWRGPIYSLKSTTSDRFLRNLFVAILFTFRDFARNLLRDNILSYLVLLGMSDSTLPNRT